MITDLPWWSSRPARLYFWPCRSRSSCCSPVPYSSFILYLEEIITDKSWDQGSMCPSLILARRRMSRWKHCFHLFSWFWIIERHWRRKLKNHQLNSPVPNVPSVFMKSIPISQIFSSTCRRIGHLIWSDVIRKMTFFGVKRMLEVCELSIRNRLLYYWDFFGQF